MAKLVHRPRRGRRGRALRTLAATCLMLGGAGAGLAGCSSGGGSHGPSASASASPSGLAATGSDAAAIQAANGFLAAWSRGDFAGAGAATDSPATASAFLHRENTDLAVSAARFTTTAANPSASGTTIAFTAAISMGSWGTWTYQSSLTVADTSGAASAAPAAPAAPTASGAAASAGGPKVVWSRAVVNPALTSGTHLRLQSFLAPRAAIEDATGQPITVAAYPDLGAVLGVLHDAPATLAGLPPATGTLVGAGGLQAKYDSQLGGTPGAGVQIVNDADGTVASTLDQIKAAVPGQPLRTTLDPAVQAAVERAVGGGGAGGKTTALVALRPSTGQILAVADTPANGFDNALLGEFAPGSTFKVISAATLLTQGAVTPTTPVPCPATIPVGGRVFQNDEGGANPAATFSDDLAASCNTAFISLAPKLSEQALTTEAANVFGIGPAWHIGTANADGKVPDPGSDQVMKAADIFGQGNITVNPLVMASVAATVEAGSFHQPVLVPGQPVATAPDPLPPTVDEQLRAMMRQVVTNGTATPALASVPGDVEAKTGSAEVANMPTSNGWMIAFRGDFAVACIVVQGGHGVDSAGPILKSLLESVPSS